MLTKATQLAIDVHACCERHRNTLRARAPTLRTQMLRAVDAIPLNIAEGAGKPSAAGFVYFLDIAIASCNEVEVQLDLAIAIGALPPARRVLRDQASEVRRMAFGLRRRLIGPRDAPPPH